MFVLKKYQQNHICMCLCWRKSRKNAFIHVCVRKNLKKIAFVVDFENFWHVFVYKCQENRVCMSLFGKTPEKSRLHMLWWLMKIFRKLHLHVFLLEKNVYVFVQKRQENYVVEKMSGKSRLHMFLWVRKNWICTCLCMFLRKNVRKITFVYVFVGGENLKKIEFACVFVQKLKKKKNQY